MPTATTYDYAIVRVVPRPEREEFVNVGVIVSCHHDHNGAEFGESQRRGFTQTRIRAGNQAGFVFHHVAPNRQ